MVNLFGVSLELLLFEVVLTLHCIFAHLQQDLTSNHLVDCDIVQWYNAFIR